MDYNTKLYDKMSTELENFISELKNQSPDMIIESAYELVIKKSILSIFKCTNFTHEEAKALFELPNSLDTLYQAWLKTDLSYMSPYSKMPIRWELEKLIKPCELTEEEINILKNSRPTTLFGVPINEKDEWNRWRNSELNKEEVEELIK